MERIDKKNKKINLKMKKTLLKRVIPLLLIAFIFQACDDQFDQVNPNALTNESFWTNTGDLNSGLNAAYAALRDENILGILFEPYRTDIAVPYSQRSNVTGNPIYDQTFDLTTDQVQDKWDACFMGIFRANQVLDAYEDLKSTFVGEEAINSGIRIEAQARAIRGYLYYVLHNSYNQGSVPVFTTVPTSFEDFQKTFSSAEEVKTFYRQELQYGIDNLPATYNAWREDAGNGNLGRITGGFCEALIAKSYMNENDFANAKTYLENVMNNYGYRLMDDLAQCFTGIDEFNDESIFEINYTTDVNLLGTDEQNLAQRISHFLNDGNRIQATSWLTLKYRAERPDPNDPANLVTRETFENNGDYIEGGDQVDVLRYYSLRMGNSLSSVDDWDSKMYGEYPAEYGRHPNAAPHAKQFPNFWKKFTHWNVPNGGAGEDESTEYDNKSGINIPVIRLAEIYLLYAECMLEEGDLSEALRYINRIRKRSHLILLGKSTDPGAEYANATTTYMDDIDLDASNGEEAVTIANLTEHLRFTEKPLELALESERYLDLRRWGVWKDQLEYIAQFEYDAYHYKNNVQGKNPVRWRNYIVPAGFEPQLPYRMRFPDKPQANNNRRAKEPHLRDHLIGSQNFNADLHSYFPIPQDEINANLNWDK